MGYCRTNAAPVVIVILSSQGPEPRKADSPGASVIFPALIAEQADTDKPRELGRCPRLPPRHGIPARSAGHQQGRARSRDCRSRRAMQVSGSDECVGRGMPDPECSIHCVIVSPTARHRTPRITSPAPAVVASFHSTRAVTALRSTTSVSRSWFDVLPVAGTEAVARNHHIICRQFLRGAGPPVGRGRSK